MRAGSTVELAANSLRHKTTFAGPAAQSCKTSNFCPVERKSPFLDILGCKSLAQKFIVLRGLLPRPGSTVRNIGYARVSTRENPSDRLLTP